MNFENILLETKNAIAYVTVNRPKVLNALNMATMEELRAAFHDIKNDKSIRVVIFTGSGEKAFIAGADIGELAKHDAVSGKEYTHRGQSVLNLIENLGKPVIACINGFALGGGCEIAMACTMRLASENAKLGQPEVKLGIIPGYGGTQRLPWPTGFIWKPLYLGCAALRKIRRKGQRRFWKSGQRRLRENSFSDVLPASRKLLACGKRRNLCKCVVAKRCRQIA